MPKPVALRDKPVYGQAMAARRSYLGKSLADLEAESSGSLYAQLLYRMENGHKDPRSMTVAQFEALLRSLEWTAADFSRETQLDLRLWGSGSPDDEDAPGGEEATPYFDTARELIATRHALHRARDRHVWRADAWVAVQARNRAATVRVDD